MANKELNKRQLRAIELLVEGEKTLEEIANDPEVHISLRQFHRWRYENEEFQAKWREMALFYENSMCDMMKLRLHEVVEEHYKVVKQNDNMSAKMKAISDWEDRTMGTATKKIEIDNKGNNDKVSNDILDEALNDDEDVE